ncbi:hypothetical protein Hte_000384 [Hypoxylon texense]
MDYLSSTQWGVVTKYEADFEKYPGDTSNLSESVYSWSNLHALLYEWGDSTDTVNIMVNGHRMAVTRNLNDVLQDLLSW